MWLDFSKKTRVIFRVVRSSEFLWLYLYGLTAYNDFLRRKNMIQASKSLSNCPWQSSLQVESRDWSSLLVKKSIQSSHFHVGLMFFPWT